MPKRKEQKVPTKCPKCGTVVSSPVKTWQLIAPIPDSAGRVTITIMGIFECPNCGYKWRGVVSKMKVGSSGIEIEGTKKNTFTIEEKEERPGSIIEIDLNELSEEEE